MTTDYPLEELGPRAFEQLAAALVMAIVGSGVEIYGSGKDGGREATFDGTIPWSAADGGTQWSGYTVIQAKEREHIAPPADNLNWLKIQIRNEFAEWMKPESRRTRFPQYIIFVTNVRLSAEGERGGVDQIRQFVLNQLDHDHGSSGEGWTLRSRGLRAIKVWHRDYLNAAISVNPGIRAAFPMLLTVGDILTRARALPGFVGAGEFAPVLVDHAQTTLRNEQWVRFDEAGDSASTRRPVDRVIVDLPARDGANRVSVLQRCIERGDHVPKHMVGASAATPGYHRSTRKWKEHSNQIPHAGLSIEVRRR